MMVATLQLKAPKLIVYFVSFTVVIFTILKITKPCKLLRGAAHGNVIMTHNYAAPHKQNNNLNHT